MTQYIHGKPADRIVTRWIHYYFQTQVEHPNWLGKTRKAFLQNQERLFKIIISLTVKKEVFDQEKKFNSMINRLIYIKQQRNFCPSCKNEKDKIKT